MLRQAESVTHGWNGCVREPCIQRNNRQMRNDCLNILEVVYDIPRKGKCFCSAALGQLATRGGRGGGGRRPPATV
jgi:hypothetical protein